MKNRVFLVFLWTWAGAGGTARAASPVSLSIQNQLEAYAARYLPFDPETKVTVTKATDTLPGFQGYHVKRTGRFEKLNLDQVKYVSEDGKWFFSGDVLKNTAPRPIRTESDLAWVSSKYTALFRTRARVFLVPERDLTGWKGAAVSLETGYGAVRMSGYASSDGSAFLQGMLWDFRMDPREERRRRIDLSAGRAQGPADAPVTVVEYADMECGYCKMRGLQMDRLLQTNAGVVNVRRYYKSFPLWFHHAWAMKAASAGDCLFRFAGPAFFRFKELVYSRQETLSVSGIDELALTSAEAEGIGSADFLSCYLRDESFARVRRDIEEGYRLSVNSTPTYFVDGTEITWIEDKVMEEFLRTLFPNTKSIEYEPPKK
ncbi:MAG: DsbA family protein [Thermoanaerobaculia bacterium]